MKSYRAKEISESPTMANVSYNGNTIYIQHVDERNQTARIFSLDDPEREEDVSVNMLSEDYRE